MNQTSIDKIESATPFLIWFRRCLPQSLQTQMRPSLDRPYQLALTILDRTCTPQPQTVKAIARSAGVAQQTVRQVLLALKEGGMTFAASSTRGWQLSEADLTLPDPTRTLDDAEAMICPSVELGSVLRPGDPPQPPLKRGEPNQEVA